jgi:hypothetical protein
MPDRPTLENGSPPTDAGMNSVATAKTRTTYRGTLDRNVVGMESDIGRNGAMFSYGLHDGHDCILQQTHFDSNKSRIGKPQVAKAETRIGTQMHMQRSNVQTFSFAEPSSLIEAP